MTDYLRSELRCSRCGGEPLRETTWFCPKCDGMENPRQDLFKAKEEIASLRQEIADAISEPLPDINSLPELTEEERAAMESCDMTPVLGDLNNQLNVACNAAIRWMRRWRVAQQEVVSLRKQLDEIEFVLIARQDEWKTISGSPAEIVKILLAQKDREIDILTQQLSEVRQQLAEANQKCSELGCEWDEIVEGLKDLLAEKDSAWKIMDALYLKRLNEKSDRISKLEKQIADHDRNFVEEVE